MNKDCRARWLKDFLLNSSRHKKGSTIFEKISHERSHTLLIIKIRYRKFLIYFCHDGYRLSKDKLNSILCLSTKYRSAPLIVSTNFRGKKVEDYVLYRRQDVCVCNIDTLISYLYHGKYPNVLVVPGGNICKLNKDFLNQFLSSNNLDPGPVLNVSSKTYKKYLHSNDDIYILQSRILMMKDMYNLDFSDNIDIYLLSLIIFKYPKLHLTNISIDKNLFG